MKVETLPKYVQVGQWVAEPFSKWGGTSAR